MGQAHSLFQRQCFIVLVNSYLQRRGDINAFASSPKRFEIRIAFGVLGGFEELTLYLMVSLSPQSGFTVSELDNFFHTFMTLSRHFASTLFKLSQWVP